MVLNAISNACVWLTLLGWIGFGVSGAVEIGSASIDVMADGHAKRVKSSSGEGAGYVARAFSASINVHDAQLDYPGDAPAVDPAAASGNPQQSDPAVIADEANAIAAASNPGPTQAQLSKEIAAAKQQVIKEDIKETQRENGGEDVSTAGQSGSSAQAASSEPAHTDVDAVAEEVNEAKAMKAAEEATVESTKPTNESPKHKEDRLRWQAEGKKLEHDRNRERKQMKWLNRTLDHIDFEHRLLPGRLVHEFLPACCNLVPDFCVDHQVNPKLSKLEFINICCSTLTDWCTSPDSGPEGASWKKPPEPDPPTVPPKINMHITPEQSKPPWQREIPAVAAPAALLESRVHSEVMRSEKKPKKQNL